MNTCTKVFLRKKEISGDRISLYLDFYPPIRNPHTNRLSRREGLGIYLYGHPANAREREFNASMMEKAEAIRCRRFEQLLNEQFGFLDKEKLRIDFLESTRTSARSFRHTFLKVAVVMVARVSSPITQSPVTGQHSALCSKRRIRRNSSERT